MNLITSWDAESVSAPHGFSGSRYGFQVWSELPLSTDLLFPLSYYSREGSEGNLAA